MDKILILFLIGVSACGRPEQSISQDRSALEQEREELNFLRTRLADLEAAQAQQSRQSSSGIPEEITRFTSQIEDLHTQLDSIRSADENISDSASFLLQSQNHAASLARNQIQSELRSTESDMQRLQQEIHYQRFMVPFTPDRWPFVEGLENRLKDLNQRAASLRQQQSQLVNDESVQSQTATNQLQQYKNSLANEETEILGQISSLRAEITRLRSQKQQIHSSTTSLADDIKRQRQAISEQEKVVKNLEQTIKR